MLNIYDPRRWYWIVGGDENRVWSGRDAAYVTATDQSFVQWREAGNTPTRILNKAELMELLANFAATVKPGPDANLDAQLAALGA